MLGGIHRVGLFDQHLHSRHSCDSQADPRDNVLAAINAGLSGLTFTEHFDTHPDDQPSCRYDDESYTATVRELRREFGRRLFIGKGIEVCFQADRLDEIARFLESHEFDLIIVSVHYFGGKSIHRKEHWHGLSQETGTRAYLEEVLSAVRHCERIRKVKGRVFDVLGHLDLAKRYTQRFFQSYGVEGSEDVLSEIAAACLEADLIPEINTSALRQGLQETMPGPEGIRRWSSLGGAAMTLGSDSHRSDDIGAGFDAGVGLLREAGLGLAVFRERCLNVIPIGRS